MSRTESFLDERREDLRALGGSAKVNGIDYLEIQPNDKTILYVYLVFPAPGEAGEIPAGAAPLDESHIKIVGGDNVRNITVQSVIVSHNRLTVIVDKVGDFSPYLLVIDHPGFDRILRELAFGFRADCISDFDCSEPELAADVIGGNPSINYLAKDFNAFRKLLLDSLSVASPDWVDRSLPDMGITLVELLAYYADHLSYAQDFISTEMSLRRARLRSSVRRHVKLLGYDTFDGLSARLFVHVVTNRAGAFNGRKIKLLTNSDLWPDALISPADFEVEIIVKEGIQVFEPIADQLDLNDHHNQFTLYDWSDERAVLPRGATEAWIIAAHADVTLKTGDFLSLEEYRDPITRQRADADLSKRQVVRLIEDPELATDFMPDSGDNVEVMKVKWHPEDALRFDLAIGTLNAADVSDGGALLMARACGNIILCDHGLSVIEHDDFPRPIKTSDPEEQDGIAQLSNLDYGFPYRPQLKHKNITISESVDFAVDERSAFDLLSGIPKYALPAITVSDATLDPWLPIKTLIGAADHQKVFVPELENDGTVYLRFPTENTGGQEPSTDIGDTLRAQYRIGIGRTGNIGAQTIGHVSLDGINGILSARNPLAGFGGENKESLEAIRIKAPASVLENHRAVTLDDYKRLTEELPYVQKAYARRKWHGSWSVVTVSVDATGDLDLTPAHLSRIRNYLEPYRLMGDDLEVVKPLLAPIELEIHVCVEEGYLQSDVLKAVKQTFSSEEISPGQYGFFHPDKLSFGDPIYLSHIYSRALTISGVADIKIIKFSRWRKADATSLAQGVLTVDPMEIPVLENDPSRPERGMLKIDVWGSV